mgnify:CR=1 FL=1
MSGTFVTVYTSEPDTMKMKNYNIQRRGVLIMKCIGIIGAMEQEVAKSRKNAGCHNYIQSPYGFL